MEWGGVGDKITDERDEIILQQNLSNKPFKPGLTHVEVG